MRHLNTLIKKATWIVRLKLNYVVKMDHKEIRCEFTDRIHTADDRFLGSWYWIILMRNKEFIQGIEQVHASQMDMYFVLSSILHKYQVFIMYCGAVRIFPYKISEFQIILRTFMCIWFRYRHCCEVIYFAEIFKFK